MNGLARTKREFLQDIVKQYRDSGQPWPTSSHDIAVWALRHDLYAPKRKSLVDQCRDELARAMREEMFRDPQGRLVRKKHAMRTPVPDEKGQLTIWLDIEDADSEQMEVAFQQRREQILGDCRQLRTDVDSFNDNNPEDANIQMLFDFEADLEEEKLPTSYPGIPG